jgi:hypothetical protein
MIVEVVDMLLFKDAPREPSGVFLRVDLIGTYVPEEMGGEWRHGEVFRCFGCGVAARLPQRGPVYRCFGLRRERSASYVAAL